MDEVLEKAVGYLQAVAMASWQVIREKSLAGQLRPLAEVYHHVDVEGFSYNDKGATYTGSSHQTLFKQDWRRAAFDINDVVSKSNIYTTTQQYLEANFSYPHVVHLFHQYAFQLFDILLQHQPQVINLTAVEAHQMKFLRDLRQDPHPAVATVYLSGVTLQSSEIMFDTHTVLRQTRVTDIEVKKHRGEEVLMIPYPSAVLELHYERRYNDYGAIHQAMGKYVMLLRLFQSASVNQDYYQIEYDTVTAPKKASSGDSGSLVIWQTYCIKTKDESALQVFLQNFRMPANFGAHDRKPDYLSTAHDRYKESLLELVPLERRIANAIMGLEALLSDNNVELTFRLSYRAAKLLGTVGYDVLKVKRYFIKAYSIRSNYAHGGFITESERQKIESNFEKLDTFALTIIDYLRVLFVISTQISVSKVHLLLLIDDALIDRKASIELNKSIKPIRDIFFKKRKY